MPRAKGKPKPSPYPRTAALFDALLRVEGEATELALHLGRIQKELRTLPPPDDFNYYAPPRLDDDEEAKRDIDARRAEALQPRKFLLRPKDRARIKEATRGEIDSDSINLHSSGKHYYSLFDTYHRDERGFRACLHRAKQAALDAARELDDPKSAALERVSSKIGFDLQNLGGAVPAPIIRGDFPPTDPEIPDLVLELVKPIFAWANKIRAFLAPGTSGPIEPRRRRRQVRRRRRSGAERQVADTAAPHAPPERSSEGDALRVPDAIQQPTPEQTPRANAPAPSPQPAPVVEAAVDAEQRKPVASEVTLAVSPVNDPQLPPTESSTVIVKDAVLHTGHSGRPRTWKEAGQYLITFRAFMFLIGKEGSGWTSKAKLLAIPAWRGPRASLFRVTDLLAAVKQAGGVDVDGLIFPTPAIRRLHPPDFEPTWASKATITPRTRPEEPAE